MKRRAKTVPASVATPVPASASASASTPSASKRAPFTLDPHALSGDDTPPMAHAHIAAAAAAGSVPAVVPAALPVASPASSSASASPSVSHSTAAAAAAAARSVTQTPKAPPLPATTAARPLALSMFGATSNFLSELDEIVDGVFARYKFLEVVGTWIVLLVSDASVNLPLEWVVFSFLSLFSYYRAFQTHLQLLVVFAILIFMLDVLTYIILVQYTAPGWLPTIANMMVFGYMVCSVRGFDAISWMLWLAFVSYDVFGRKITMHAFLEPLAVHCVGYGFYLIITEFASLFVDRDTLKETESQLLQHPDGRSYAARMLFLENRLEVCVESFSSTTMSFSLGLLAHEDPNNHLKLEENSFATSRVWSFFMTPLTITTLNAYVDNLVSKDRRSSSRPVSKPSNSLDELLPQPSQWDLSEKNLLVIANGKAVPSANIRRTHSGGGADDEVPTLTVSDLPPGTTNTLRVFLKVSALECIVSSSHVAFTTAASSPTHARKAVLVEDAAGAAVPVPAAAIAAATLETDAVTAAAASEASGSPYEAGIVADPALAALATTASLSTDTLTVMSTAELERTVEIEHVIRKEQQATIKRLKRDFQKQESALKTELQSLQNSMLKDETKEKREQRRVESLRQTLKQQETTMQQLEDDIAQIRVERKELAEKILAAQAAVARSTENLQANERALAKVMSQHAKSMGELDKEQTRALREANQLKTSIEKAQLAFSGALEQLSSLNHEIDMLQEQQQLVTQDAEELIGQEPALVREADVERQTIEQNFVSLLSRNQILSDSLQDEAKYRQQLLDEIEREGGFFGNNR